ncbi:MAG: mechanosensitive ion channel domain-containing protein [Pseudomonadales bacterium]|jgi:potassium efflux system protein|nr:mechanosensitive ion channel domain-containing protein [Pseudomonadales bacterium]
MNTALHRSGGHDGWPSWVHAWAVLLLVLFVRPVQAADSEELTPVAIEARIQQLETSTTLPEASRVSALESYRRALVSVKAALGHRELAQQFRVARSEAPAQAGQLLERLASDRDALVDGPAPELAADASAQEIERRLQQERSNLALASARLAELKQRIAAEQARRPTILTRITAASQDARGVLEELGQLDASDQDPLVTARRWETQARAAALNAELARLDEELLSQPARLELLEAQREEAALQVSRSSALVDLLQERLGIRRTEQAAQSIAAVASPPASGEDDVPAPVQALKARNAELARDLVALTARLNAATARASELVAELEALRDRYADARKKLEQGRVSPALARYLTDERRNLRRLRESGTDTARSRRELDEADLREVQLEEAARELESVEAVAAGLLAEFPVEEREGLKPAGEELLAQRVELIEQLAALNADFVRQSAELEYVGDQLGALVDEYGRYLDRRLLWVRSQPVLGAEQLLALPEDFGAFLAPARWSEVARVFFRRSLESPLQLTAYLALLLYFWKRPWLRQRLARTAAGVGRPSQDTILSTVTALGLTLLMALPWPLLAVVTGYELSYSSAATDASAAVGRGLFAVAPMLLFVLALRCLCVPGGVAMAHLRWAPSAVERLRGNLDLLAVSVLVPAFAMATNVLLTEALVSGALNQLFLTVLALGLTVFLFRLFAPRSGIAWELHGEHEAPAVPRWRWAVCLVVLALPVAVAVVALAGFMFSAATLLGKLFNTVWLGSALLLAREVLLRWLLVVRRRILLQQALERRAARLQAREEGDEARGTDDVAEEEDRVDVVALDADTRTLVNVGALLVAVIGVASIWSSVFPALSQVFDRTLWEYVRTVDGETRTELVTAGDLLLSLGTLVMTVLLARRIPSLLEIVLRQTLPIAPGSRLAFLTLIRYALVGTGVFVSLSLIGIDWTKLQWLVAALGVGIGFGLQEIVANFISGLIILIERPVRVGDVVTVGEVSGTVTRVQIRATTIRNWDQQELIVPNKEFITGRVLNWSLSDDVLRIFIPVGIAYGSDVDKAFEILLRTAREHPEVLKDPEPFVTFERFGDNARELALRCYVASVNVFLSTQTELHRTISERFDAAGVTIAFPQQDVHLDARGPLDVRLHPAGTDLRVSGLPREATASG